MDKHYLIPEALLQATLDYLGKRPFVEVADAIYALRQLRPVAGTTEAPEPDADVVLNDQQTP